MARLTRLRVRRVVWDVKKFFEIVPDRRGKIANAQEKLPHPLSHEVVAARF